MIDTKLEDMRSMWKGHIRFSLVTIPVQIFNAIESSNNVRFNQLHKEDHGKIKYKKICSSCDEEVPFSDIVKGFEYEPDMYVVVTKDELKSITTESNRAIDITAFVDLKEVSPSRFEAVYYVGPNGDIAHSTFNLLVQTLIKTGKAGVGKIVLRDREDVVLLAPEKNGLVMYKLRYPEELRNIADVPDLKTVEVDKSQLDLAETLVSSLSKSFEEIVFEDNYREDLMGMINKKIEGKEVITVREEEESAPVVDIMDALKKSIEEAKKLKQGA